MEESVSSKPVFSKEERDYLNIIDKNFNSNDKYFCCSAYRDVMSYTSFKIGRYPFEDEDVLNVLADFVAKDEAEKSREKAREKAMQKLKKMNSDELVEIFDKCCPCNRYIGRMEEFNEWLEAGIKAEKSWEKGMKTPVLSKEEQDYLNIIDKNFNVNDKYFCYSPYRDVMSYTSFKIGRYPFEDEDILNAMADSVVKGETEKSREKAMQKLKKMNSDELISVFNESCPYSDRYIADMEEFDEWFETGIDAELGVSPERLAFLMKYVNNMIK